VFAARSFEAQKDTPALAAPFESAKQGVHFAAKRTTPARNFATKKREKAAFLLAKSKQTSTIPQKFQNVNPFLKMFRPTPTIGIRSSTSNNKESTFERHAFRVILITSISLTTPRKR
jgi:hypothetical protein